MINQDIVKFIDCICEMAPRQNIKNRDATTQAYILSNFFDTVLKPETYNLEREYCINVMMRLEPLYTLDFLQRRKYEGCVYRNSQDDLLVK